MLNLMIAWWQSRSDQADVGTVPSVRGDRANQYWSTVENKCMNNAQGLLYVEALWTILPQGRYSLMDEANIGAKALDGFSVSPQGRMSRPLSGRPLRDSLGRLSL